VTARGADAERLGHARLPPALRDRLHVLEEPRRRRAAREIENLRIRLDLGPAGAEADQVALGPVAFVDREDLPLDEDDIGLERRARPPARAPRRDRAW
jgi:hypothetical protein